jgi:hypothetical protein
VRAMEIVLELISFVLASKKTWQHNIFFIPIPFRGGPSIAPGLDDLNSISSSTLLQDAPALLKKDSPIEVKIIRLEQLGESSLKGIFESVAKSIRNQSFINALLQMLGTAMCSNIQTPALFSLPSLVCPLVFSCWRG